jgi:hypothetical protein
LHCRYLSQFYRNVGTSQEEEIYYEVEKRAQIQAIAQAEFDATNLAVKQALASRSGSLKRQSSSANIDQEANKKAATNGDGQSASNSLSVNTDDVLD